MTTKKIDSSGNYLSFPGFTVVADVYAQNNELFQKIHEQLRNCPLIVDYYALLPAESYHITTFGIKCQKKMDSKNFNSWINGNLEMFQTVNSEIEQGTEAFSYRISGVRKNQLTFLVSVNTSAAQNQRRAASKTPYEKDIPRSFHISLGYQYKDFPDDTILPRIVQHLENILSDLLPFHETTPLQANKPELCYFHDMTRFIPWNGESNPFL
jgi:hypothetical protein